MAMENLGKLAVGIATLTIALVVVFLVLAQAQDEIVSIDDINESNVSDYSTSYNATITLTNAVATIPGWVPLIVISVVGATLLGLVALFRGRK